MWTFTTYFFQLLWSALNVRPAGALLAGNMLLYTNAITPTPATALGALVEPTYTSYARQAVVITGPFVGGGSQYYVLIGDVAWTQTSGDTAQDILGAAIVDGSDNLLLVGNFAETEHLSGPGSGFSVGGPVVAPVPPPTGAWDIEP